MAQSPYGITPLTTGPEILSLQRTLQLIKQYLPDLIPGSMGAGAIAPKAGRMSKAVAKYLKRGSAARAEQGKGAAAMKHLKSRGELDKPIKAAQGKLDIPDEEYFKGPVPGTTRRQAEIALQRTIDRILEQYPSARKKYSGK
jgi:hypothetical protein